MSLLPPCCIRKNTTETGGSSSQKHLSSHWVVSIGSMHDTVPLRGCCSAQVLVWHCPALACVGKWKMRNGSVTGGGHGLEEPNAFAIWNRGCMCRSSVASTHPCAVLLVHLLLHTVGKGPTWALLVSSRTPGAASAQ